MGSLKQRVKDLERQVTQLRNSSVATRCYAELVGEMETLIGSWNGFADRLTDKKGENGALTNAEEGKREVFRRCARELQRVLDSAA